tara:strand:+ start:618 stop:926 length:309 start_codon:yes stop_codon:yes gene_type:complete
VGGKLKYDRCEIASRIDTSSKGEWIPRGIRTGDIVIIKPHLEKYQADLFPAAGLCVVLKTVDGIFNRAPGDRFLYVYSKKRGKFKIEASCCTIIIEGYYDPG